MDGSIVHIVLVATSQVVETVSLIAFFGPLRNERVRSRVKEIASASFTGLFVSRKLDNGCHAVLVVV
jgi:hypothetical protein